MDVVTTASKHDLLALRHRLVRLARRHGRRRDDDEDLAHDLIVAALRRGLALDDDHFTRSLGGAARRHAAFVARSSVRRHRRDARLVRNDHDDDHGAVDDDNDDNDVVRTPLSSLSPALLTTLVLLRAGLDKAGICAVCGINDAALRKRLQGLRAAAPIEALSLPSLPASTARFARRTSSLALLQALSRARTKKASTSTSTTTTSFAIHDPDGHGLIFGSSLGSLTDPASTATAMKNTVAPSRGPKGPAC